MHITHINDVLPHVEGRRDFVVVRKDGYTVIDYVFAGSDTFDHPARIECRGLKFGEDGRIIARPFQKFFNVGERAETFPEKLDFSQPHIVMDKLDGSMIHPAVIGGEVVFMTRMGRTDVARKAERHLSSRMRDACMDMLYLDMTPIFEFTAPDNRIVIAYADSRLTLLAVRKTVVGTYSPDDDVEYFARCMGVDSVPTTSFSFPSGRAFAEHARAIRGKEGFVVRFSSGLMVKAKGEDYVLKHRAKESVLQEKNVLQLVLRGGIDDVLPLLEPQDRMAVERYRDAVMNGVEEAAELIRLLVASGGRLDQRTFATEHVADIADVYRPLAFKVRSGANPREAVKSAIMKSATSAAGVEHIRPLFDATFDLCAANDNGFAKQVAA